MCQFAAPPGIIFAGPLQAPLGWLLILLELLVMPALIVIRRRFPLLASTEWWRRRSILVFLWYGCTLVGTVLAFAVVDPTQQAIHVWRWHQESALLAQHCSTAAINLVESRLQAPVGVLRGVQVTLTIGASVLMMIWLAMGSIQAESAASNVSPQ